MRSCLILFGLLIALNGQDYEYTRSVLGNPFVALMLALPVQERINLVELIWESVAAVPQAIEVSPEVKADLAARLIEFERDPEAGYSWDQVKEKLKNGSWPTA